jgi:hypothetical protein
VALLAAQVQAALPWLRRCLPALVLQLRLLLHQTPAG